MTERFQNAGTAPVSQLSETFALHALARVSLAAVMTLSALCSTYSSANSSGAPVCEITPATFASFHGQPTITSPNGWQINATPSQYVPNVPITITLTNTVNVNQTVRGFLMWVKRQDGTRVGTWLTQANFSRLATNCSSTTLTHTANTNKQQGELSFSFTPPRGEAGPLTISAAIVESCNVSNCRPAHAFPTLSVSTVTPRILNIDGDSAVNPSHALTDGLLLLRHRLGLTGPALVDRAVSPSAIRNATQINSYITDNLLAFDIDGDNAVLAATDGILVLRYLLGFRGGSLVANATNTPVTAAEVETRIAALLIP